MNSITPGKHLIIDFWDVKNIKHTKQIETALRNASAACGATILNIDLHEFGEGHGVTGVAILAESHISIHTWPEISYVALDVFTCGSCNAEAAIQPLQDIFQPGKTKITTIMRGTDAES